MGSKASSHMVSSESPQPSSMKSSSGPRRSWINRGKLKLSSLFCGAFNSKSTLEAEDCREKLSTSCSRKDSISSNGYQNPSLDPSSIFSSEVGGTSSMHENEDSSGRNSSNIEDTSVEFGVIDIQASMDLIDLSNTNHILTDQPFQESVSGDSTDFLTRESPYVAEVNDQSQGELNDIEYYHDLSSFSITSDGIPQFEIPENDRAQPPVTPTSEFPVSENEQSLRNMSQLQLDLVSMSFDMLSNTVEPRRNSSRRPFWDSFLRRSFTRHSDSTSLVLHTSDLADDVGPRGRRRHNFDSDLRHDEPSHDLDAISAINHRRNARRLQLRTEILDRAIGGLTEGRQQSAQCPSGIHGDGNCYCHMLFSAEESRNLASISRIILLAEALFEVLDEIHQSTSLSLPSLTLPAPGPVVDSFPIKHHCKNKATESNRDDVQQCYVCLADYDEGDELRVLPCNHEYHVSCIDKWLKEVNRVCPLCRQNVCDDSADCSV